MVRVKSPMLFSVGMYLPLETTFAIFIGGMIAGLWTSGSPNGDTTMRRRLAWRMPHPLGFRVDRGEALVGLCIATVVLSGTGCRACLNSGPSPGLKESRPGWPIPVSSSWPCTSSSCRCRKRTGG